MTAVKNNKIIKIGLDFHGVISAQPRFFADFSVEALRRGYEVHIITGGPEEFIRDELKRLNISYTKIFAIMDTYKDCLSVVTYRNGELHIDDKIWNMAKAEYCRKQAIDLHIDDSKTYVKWFTTPYCRYDNGKCLTDRGVVLNFEDPAEKVLNSIEEVLFFDI